MPTTSLRAAQIARGIGALLNPTRPMLAQVVVTRRCNLECGYCNEFDKISAPVPTATLVAYIDHLAALGTQVVTFTGGEPLLHPELDTLVARVNRHNMVPTSITNGFLLTKEWVERLNDAGLYLLQVSVDNLDPNRQSQKSFNLLKKKLPLLSQYARFNVNVNAVLGSSPVAETRELARQVRAMGFYMTVGLLHSSNGSLDRGLLAHRDLEPLFNEMTGDRRRSFFHRFGEGWEHEMIRTGQSDWKCRAGARYLYVDEFGIVSYCSQRRNDPGIPLLEYGKEQLRRSSTTRKGCELTCTVACVRRASSVDSWRGQEAEITPRPDIEGLPATT
ncbi:MAG TPA: radical SAM protein [bacterium]|nr:radical SAM protein [bacterium]